MKKQFLALAQAMDASTEVAKRYTKKSPPPNPPGPRITKEGQPASKMEIIIFSFCVGLGVGCAFILAITCAFYH